MKTSSYALREEKRLVRTSFWGKVRQVVEVMWQIWSILPLLPGGGNDKKSLLPFGHCVRMICFNTSVVQWFELLASFLFWQVLKGEFLFQPAHITSGSHELWIQSVCSILKLGVEFMLYVSQIIFRNSFFLILFVQKNFWNEQISWNFLLFVKFSD